MTETNLPVNTADIPPEIKGWNWGAFWLNWIWGIGNQTYIALLCFVPFLNFIMMIILGLKGNEWAWENRHWDSVEHFQKTQRVWARWGWGLFIAGIILSLLLIFSLASLMGQYY